MKDDLSKRRETLREEYTEDDLWNSMEEDNIYDRRSPSIEDNHQQKITFDDFKGITGPLF